MRSPANKVGFIIQHGYFRASGKFFTNDYFADADINYVCALLNTNTSSKEVLCKYSRKSRVLHKNFILKHYGWSNFTSDTSEAIKKELLLQARQQMHPKSLFPIATNFLINKKIELPSYYILADMITDVYNDVESYFTMIVDEMLSNNQREILDDLIWIGDKRKKSYKYSALARVKNINLSDKTDKILDSIKTYRVLKAFYYKFRTVYEKLNLSEHASGYYSEWVQRSKLFQLKQFKQRSKAYFYLLSHLKHQYFRYTDAYIDVSLKLVRSARNSMDKKLDTHKVESMRAKSAVVEKLLVSFELTDNILNKISLILNDGNIDSNDKVEQIRNLIATHMLSDEVEGVKQDHVIKSLQDNQIDDGALKLKTKLLRSMGASLQRRISPILVELDLDLVKASHSLTHAIETFKYCARANRNDYETSVLSKAEEKLALNANGTISLHAYKALLFIKIHDSIKSGEINCNFSYKYLSLNKYLIEEDRWKQHEQMILSIHGLSAFSSCTNTLDSLRRTTNDKYQHVNNHYANGENKYLSVKNDNTFTITTPKIREHEPKNKLAPIFAKDGIVPILTVLELVNNATNFTACFKHHSTKNVIMKPSSQDIFAGLLGKGCNHGIIRMANISKGITEDVLKNTINWFFSLQNIQDANDIILEYINKLSLPNIYKLDDKYSHTSSDGQKFNVGVNSILADYSFKYFGQLKGISVYSFIDDRQALFHNTVLSPGEREAAYVIDGIMKNDVIKSFIHSTDTHGYSEAIFAIMHLLGVSFAPRIKKLGKQKLYCLDPKPSYNKLDYKIKPDTKINLKLIQDNWDDILKLVATIKSKTTTASQIFKRLNSYTKEPKLYSALKEFGRIIKTNYILTYIDDVRLRQRIEKQLNKIELSNKFAKAVFFANSQEFRIGSTEEQQIIVACKSLIQNCVVLWNYLYLSNVLINQSAEERALLLTIIKQSSVLSWRHINLHGEYDFTAANDQALGKLIFDLRRIQRLKVA